MRPDRDSTTEKRQQEPPGDRRGQPGQTANTQTRQATRHNTSQHQRCDRAPHREQQRRHNKTAPHKRRHTGRNSPEHHGKARNNAEKERKRQRKPTENTAAHDSTTQQDPAQHRAGKQGARPQPITSDPHSTRQNTQHTTDHSTRRHDAKQRAQQPARGRAGQHIQDTPKEKKTPRSQHRAAEKKKKSRQRKAKEKNPVGGGRGKKEPLGGGKRQDAKAQGTLGRESPNAGHDRGAQKKRQKPKKKKRKRKNSAKTKKTANPARRGPSKQRTHHNRPRERVSCTRTCPGGRPA